MRSLLNVPARSSNRFIGRIARLPLDLVPREAVVPILSGNLRGKRWITGAGIHRCWLGLYERKKQLSISREVKAGTVFWDVGANVGFYSLLASNLVGPGKVFALEPVPRNLFYLRRHLDLNRVRNVEVLAIAVSNANGTSSFETEETGFMGRLSEQGRITVSTATLDSLVEDNRVLPPHYVKMDIEGAEFQALLGSSRTFQRYHPLLFLATHGKEVHAECVRLLESWGYRCNELANDGSEELRELVARFDSQPASAQCT